MGSKGEKIGISQSRYSQGSIRKLRRASGFVWEWRYYITTAEGERQLKQKTFSSKLYPTEKALRLGIEPLVQELNQGPAPQAEPRTFAEALDKYVAEELVQLNPTTQATTLSIIGCHIRPKWGSNKLEDITAMRVKTWLESWETSGHTRARARNLISRIFDMAMLWEWIPTQRNPMELVRVKSTERVREIAILTLEQFRSLLKELEEPYATMVLIAGTLGLRVSEVLALHWSDFDFDSAVKTVSLNRRYSHGRLSKLKTRASKAVLPVEDALATKILSLPRENELLFPSPTTGLYFSDSTILSKKIKPAAKAVGLGNIGWHSFRHTYRSWLDAEKVSIGTMKDLMRHSDVSMTMNTYGRALPAELREGNAKVVRLVLS